MDTMKIARSIYQYTAIDDCSRFRVLAVCPRRNAHGTLLFLDRVIKKMPFPIPSIQSDWGTELFAESVQRRLMSECIKFRPIPRLTHHARDGDALDERIEEWQCDYDWRRPHGPLGGKTPVGRIAELSEITSLIEEIADAYDKQKERIRHRERRVEKIRAEHQRRMLELASPSGAASSSRSKKRHPRT